jgi:Domain of unknown function (DUF4136)
LRNKSEPACILVKMKAPALKRHFSSLTRLGLAAALLSLLAACASPITARVTSFNQWPANSAGSTFSYVSRTDNTRELEQATYENYVQAELEKRGLVRAPAGQVGRMQVDVTTSNRSEQRTYLQPIYQDNYVYLPGYRDAAGRIYPGVWTLDPFGPRYVGDRQINTTFQTSTLQVRLLDSQGAPAGKPRTVFESRAIFEGEGSGENLPQVVPYLVRAVFDDFPGQNGRTRVVRFDRETGAVIKDR